MQLLRCLRRRHEHFHNHPTRALSQCFSTISFSYDSFGPLLPRGPFETTCSASSGFVYFCTYLFRGLCRACSPREEKRVNPSACSFVVWMTCTTPAPARKHAAHRRGKKKRARQLGQMRASSICCTASASFLFWTMHHVILLWLLFHQWCARAATGSRRGHH